ncbi:hypothetical protein Ahia01_001141800 [Argonauta hians]
MYTTQESHSRVDPTKVQQSMYATQESRSGVNSAKVQPTMYTTQERHSGVNQSIELSNHGTYRKKTSNHSGNTSTLKTKLQRHLVSSCCSPESTLQIPRDGSLLSFSTKDIVSIMVCLNLEPTTIHHINDLHLNGKKLSALTDNELKELGIDNPVIRYFRDRSKVKQKYELSML